MRRCFMPCLLLALLAVGGCTRPGIETLADWRLKADQAYDAGKYAEALDYYGKLAKAVPSEAEIWFRLGNTHARLNRSEDAVKAYREAVLRDPRFAKAWYNAGLNQLRSSATTFSESLKYINKSDPVYAVSEQYYMKLLVLMEQQNAALLAATRPVARKPIDVEKVEVIVLDGKAGNLSADDAAGPTHEDLMDALYEQEQGAATADPAPVLPIPGAEPVVPSGDPGWHPPMAPPSPAP